MTIYEFMKVVPYGDIDFNIYSSNNAKLLDTYNKMESNQVRKIRSKYGSYKVISFSFSNDCLEIFVKPPIYTSNK